MPDKPESNKRPPLEVESPVSAAAAPLRYAELHCKTNFSFLEAASHPDEVVLRAAELGYAALGITDRNSLAGVVRAHGAAKQLGLKLLIGAEITLVDAPPLVLWASDRASYGRLSRLITCGRRRAEKGEFLLRFDDLAAHEAGLLAGVLLPQLEPMAPTGQEQRRSLHRYRELFGDRCYALAELHRGPDDERLLASWLKLSHASGVPLAAAGDVHYHDRSRLALQDVLTAIRLGSTVDQIGDVRFANAERCLKPVDDLAARFRLAPQAIERTIEIADRATFSLDELRYEYPEELAPPGETPLAYLHRLAWQGARDRYPDGIPTKVRELVEHELRLIAELHYEAYFLTVYDLVKFARSRDILCQGRGSAANSAVCYCLGVTSVDPTQMDVLFERFVSRERQEAPDIDVDFEHERREEVLQYLYDKYGRERTGMTAEVITYRPRSAVRDVGKALGLSLDRVDRLAKSLEGHHLDTHLVERCRDAGIDPHSPLGRRLLGLVGEILGFPRHLGQHVGGMVMTQGPLCELVPIENAAMPGRTVIEWDKDDLDELGILKVDCLALGMLTAIHKCFALIERQVAFRVRSAECGVRNVQRTPHSELYIPHSLTLANIPQEDPAVYAMISRADTMGVFQIESRAQMSMLPRLRPKTFYDLVIEVAIVRPGPIQGNMVHPYLRRRAGEEAVTYPNEAIRQVLHKTLGVPLFQEQAMRLAVVAAGFTPGEADQLRRAMGAWRRPGIIEQFRQKLIDGMLARGLSTEFAEQVFTQIRGFGEYGFPESHAASFALLVYVSAWLKHYYPAPFAAALINSQPMGFYAPAQLVRNAREHGVEVLPVDVNHSDWDCTLELRNSECGVRNERPIPQSAIRNPQSPALRLGLRMILGFNEALARTIEHARRSGAFTSLADFARRTGLTQAAVSRLADAGAFGSLRLERRQALWQALSLEKKSRPMPLLAAMAESDELCELLPAMAEQEEVLADYQTSGLSLRSHPIEFQRSRLNEMKVTPAAELAELPNDRLVRVAGLVLVRQRPGTARGITFVTLEDETGAANLIIRQEIWQRYYQAARTAAALIAHGRLQRKDEVTHVLVSKLEDFTAEIPGLRSRSRDFH
jgi:error-prone DNA polymerase